MGWRRHLICDEKKIIVLGERTHEAFPECPVLGPDIVRDTQSGRLYVLEMNSYGAVWLRSLAKKLDPEHVRARYAQFNALDRAADLLIQTRLPPQQVDVKGLSALVGDVVGALRLAG